MDSIVFLKTHFHMCNRIPFSTAIKGTLYFWIYLNRTSTCISRVEILFQALKETSIDLKVQVSINSNVKQAFDWCSDKSKRFSGRGQVFCLCCRVNHEAGCIFPISKVFPEDPSSQSTWLLANKPLRKVVGKSNPTKSMAWQCFQRKHIISLSSGSSEK